MIYVLTTSVKNLPPAGGPFPEPTPEQIGDFYVRLGMAVAAWQLVEANLVHIYASALGTQNYEALTVSFHVPNSFRTRLDMTNEAVKCSNMSGELAYQKVKKKARRRNELMHGIVIFDTNRAKADQQLFLSQNISDPRFQTGFAPGSIITQSELETMTQAFEVLRREMFAFFQKLPPAIRPASC